MEGELIFLGFIMLIGQIILLEMWNRNWFKKENFKIQKFNVMAENKIKLKKLERDLGLTISKTPKEQETVMEKIGGIASILKNLDSDQIKKLADTFLAGEGEEYEEDEDEDLIGTILKNIPKDTIEKFVSGLSEKTKEQIRTNNY